jgi:hypothetical protein
MLRSDIVCQGFYPVGELRDNLSPWGLSYGIAS